MLVEALMGSVRIPKTQSWSFLPFFLPVAFSQSHPVQVISFSL